MRKRMKTRIRTSLIFLLAVLMICSLAACGGSSSGGGETAGDTYTVGVVFPRSGSNALLGEQAWMGAEVARQMVNEAGGVNGVMIEFASADAPSSNEASTEAGRLIDQKGVNVIIGSLTSGNSLAIRSITDRNEAILWETSGISDAVTDDNSGYVFRTCDKGGLRGFYGMQFVAEELAAELGVAPADLKIVFVNEDSSYGESIAEGALEGAEQNGLNVVLHERYNSSVTDMSSMVMRIKNMEPDVIFAVSYVNDAVLLYDTLKQYNALPAAFVGCGAGYNDQNFGKTLGDAEAEGIFCIDMPTNVTADMLSKPETKTLLEEFNKRYLEMDKSVETPALAATCSFMGTYVLLNDVLPAAESFSSDDIRAAAEKANVDETILGWSVQFDEDGQNIGAVPVVGQWQSGKIVTVWPENYAVGKMTGIPLSR